MKKKEFEFIEMIWNSFNIFEDLNKKRIPHEMSLEFIYPTLEEYQIGRELTKRIVWFQKKCSNHE